MNRETSKTYSQFINEMKEISTPIILLEGKRKIPDEYTGKASRLASQLAQDLPHAVFRSGNAEGSDHS